MSGRLRRLLFFLNALAPITSDGPAFLPNAAISERGKGDGLVKIKKMTACALLEKSRFTRED